MKTITVAHKEFAILAPIYLKTYNLSFEWKYPSEFYIALDRKLIYQFSKRRANQITTVEKAPSGHMPNMPSVDFHLEREIMKATQMLLAFRHTLGEEKIPRELLDIAKGVVFLTIIKAGFMFSGRYGTGLVVAKLPDNRWSAPSAVMLSGLGWGLQVGAELTDVMLILSTDQAVKAFQSRAQVSVGAELGVSVGPIGRSIESDVTAGTKGAAHAFAYARSKGLFVGASLEAAGIASRPDVNTAFYGERVSTSALLSGEYPAPIAATPLYNAIFEVLMSREDHIAQAARPTQNAIPYAPELLRSSSTNNNRNSINNNFHSHSNLDQKGNNAQQHSGEQTLYEL